MTYLRLIRQRCRPLAPLATGERPILRRLPGIRAVLFDIYGTLMISANGDVGGAGAVSPDAAFRSALAAAGVRVAAEEQLKAETLVEQIHREHAAQRAGGVAHPEVDIVAIWQRTLSALRAAGAVAPVAPAVDLQRLAIEFEVRANPVWPMPGLRHCLGALRQAGLTLGIISNAQFYTPELFPALLGATLEEVGFDPGLQYYSYRLGQAKPGRLLYETARQGLRQRGIRSEQALYVGNDMLNDILPAGTLGFRTALFAGDARSLRRRRDDPRTAGISPDLVITELSAIAGCVAGGARP